MAYYRGEKIYVDLPLVIFHFYRALQIAVHQLLVSKLLGAFIIGAVIAPWLTALGVIAALVANCKIVVERRE